MLQRSQSELPLHTGKTFCRMDWQWRGESQAPCIMYRVATCLENLEMTGNLTVVREMSGILLKVREVSGKCQGTNLVRKSGLKLFIVSCIIASFLTVLNLSISFSFWIMHCCIPTPTTDNNTSTGMIWVTLNMGWSAANHQEMSWNCQGISHCMASGHPACIVQTEMLVIHFRLNITWYRIRVIHHVTARPVHRKVYQCIVAVPGDFFETWEQTVVSYCSNAVRVLWRSDTVTHGTLNAVQ